jgi:RNA polymerase sigma factor (sigma-70 family)
MGADADSCVSKVVKAIMAWLAWVTAQSGLTRYIAEIRRVPMLEPHEEYMLAKRWRKHDDLEAVHKLVNSHLRLVASIAKSYRGYGLPISELISEGNVGLMHAVKRFEPEKGFRLATYAKWWIKAAIQEYILRSWSLVKMGTIVNQKKLFFNLRKAKSKISVLDEGDLRPDQVNDPRGRRFRRVAGLVGRRACRPGDDKSSTAAARRLKSENSDVSPILGCASDLNLPQRR